MKLPSVGHAFAFRIENGMYGACRVVRFIARKPQNKDSCDAVLVACCDWIGDAIPAPKETDLKAIMRLTHHRWDVPCICWGTSPIPDSFVYIGTIPPSDSELVMPCDSTVKWSFFPIQRLSQWEWDNQLDKAPK